MPTHAEVERMLLREELGRIAYRARKLQRLADAHALASFARDCTQTIIYRLDDIERTAAGAEPRKEGADRDS